MFQKELKRHNQAKIIDTSVFEFVFLYMTIRCEHVQWRIQNVQELA